MQHGLLLKPKSDFFKPVIHFLIQNPWLISLTLRKLSSLVNLIFFNSVIVEHVRTRFGFIIRRGTFLTTFQRSPCINGSIRWKLWYFSENSSNRLAVKLKGCSLAGIKLALTAVRFSQLLKDGIFHFGKLSKWLTILTMLGQNSSNLIRICLSTTQLKQ